MADAPRIFGDILPYWAEVSEPNGKRISAFVLSDYGDRCQEKFERWLEEHDKQLRAEALEEAAVELEQQGVEPWDRNSVAIRTLRFRADRLRSEA